MSTSYEPLIRLYKLESTRTSAVYASGLWIDGNAMSRLEKDLSEYLGVKHVILTNSGTSALLAAYWVLKSRFATVNVDPYTFPATYQPARLLNYDVKFIRNILNEPIKIMSEGLNVITHLFGQPNRLLDTKAQNFIEDACQSFGAEFEGKKVGTFGLMGCFSFYPTKSLHTCGHGGALVTNDAELYHKAKGFTESGRVNGVMTDTIALNLRMDEIKAEFLVEELKSYDENMGNQRRIAQQFINVIPKPQPFLSERNGDRHVYSVFNLMVDDRNKFRAFFDAKGIETAIYYDTNMLPLAQRANYNDITDHIVSIPCRYSLTSKEVDRLLTALQEWYK
ncbi:MAG: DegT/DnrJ/EryC1/StrS family aminotransferase [Pedobacter sp.]|nr:DegT/DnrJ/EryC1/StrS family aminotransferase [Pedobacter sp.]